MNYNKDTILLFLFQILAHVALVYGIFYFTPLEWIISFLIYFITGCVGVSITYHRLLSHRSFTPPGWFEKVGTIIASYGLVGSSLGWVNNHRSHHRHVDKIGDPHSPTILGIFRVQWMSMFTSEKSFRYIKQYIKSPFHVFAHRYYFAIHTAFLISVLFLFGWHEAALFYLVPAGILWNAGSLINTLCHLNIGYRNYSLADNSSNNLILGYLVWGEGWHNNHHRCPASAKFGEKWWEFDISYAIIHAINIKASK